jgi:hypothetical protein
MGNLFEHTIVMGSIFVFAKPMLVKLYLDEVISLSYVNSYVEAGTNSTWWQISQVTPIGASKTEKCPYLSILVL